MTTTEGFARQNAVGEVAEKSVRAAFDRHPDWSVTFGNARGSWDFQARHKGGRVESIEVKNESNHRDTGNVAIETFQGTSRRPSGVLSSEATVCVHWFGKDSLVYRRTPMVNHIRGMRARPFGKADNGNGGHVIPVTELRGRPWVDRCSSRDIPDSPVMSPLGSRQPAPADDLDSMAWKCGFAS